MDRQQNEVFLVNLTMDVHCHERTKGIFEYKLKNDLLTNVSLPHP